MMEHGACVNAANANGGSPGPPPTHPNASDHGGMPPSLLSHRLETLEGVGDLDYLTHIVFRMYECFDFPATDPKRFRIEILLSTGVGLDPFKQDVIAEFKTAAENAKNKEAEAKKPKRGSIDGRETEYKLPVLKKSPIHNDRACVSAAEDKKGAAAGAAKEDGKETPLPA